MISKTQKTFSIGIIVVLIAVSFYYYQSSNQHLTTTSELPVPANMQSYVDRIKVVGTDSSGATYTLKPKLVIFNNATSGDPWTEYTFPLVHEYPVGGGAFGDTECFLQLWDARQVAGRGYVQFEISRSGWSQYDIYVDNQLMWTFPQVISGVYPPYLGYADGVLYSNGTHSPNQ